MDIGNILRQLGIFYGHLVIWYIFLRFGILCKEKSGNPVSRPETFPFFLQLTFNTFGIDCNVASAESVALNN
jgi:hypothetical protein